MARSKVGGADRTIAFVEHLPEAARDELAEILRDIGFEVQEYQRSLAPYDTGQLRRAIAWKSVVQALKVRIGLIDIKRSGNRAGSSDVFYGRIVNFGRKAQVVLVQRRRRVGGVLRTSRGRKRASDIVATYALHVRARAPVPFIAIDAGVESRADSSLASFWSRALSRAE